MQEARFILRDLNDTQAMADMFVNQLPVPQVFALTGELGSGKTSFVQCLARAMGIPDMIPSPTFTLINEYHTKSDKSLVHADLYRLASKTEIKQLGLHDHFTDPQTITAVEWADRAEDLFPQSAVWLNFESVDERRIVTLRTQDGQLWHKLRLGAI
jgi:tRNA threonylcarbamoyladenosine biosynthesis protein TsaE